MKWYHVFIKSIREQVRDYWILLIVVLLAPFFIFVYYLMIETENPNYDVLLVNNDRGSIIIPGYQLNLGDSLITFLKDQAGQYEEVMLNYYREETRDIAINKIRDEKADVLLVIPSEFTLSVLSDPSVATEPANYRYALYYWGCLDRRAI